MKKSIVWWGAALVAAAGSLWLLSGPERVGYSQDPASQDPAKPNKSSPPKLAIPPGKPPAKSAIEEKIYAALAKTSTLEITDQPLTDVAVALEQAFGVPVRLDTKPLTELAVLERHITLKAKGTSLRAALELALKEHDCTWIIRYESLLITSIEEHHKFMTTRLYDIADLLIYLDETGQVSIEDEDYFAEAIASLVAPDSWKPDVAAGGDGSGNGVVKVIPIGGLPTLLVSQTRQVHEEIESLLTTLHAARRLSDLPVDLTGAQTKSRKVAVPGSGAVGQLPSEKPLEELPADPGRDAIVSAGNQFACDLYAKLRADAKGNLFVSPYSVSNVLTMIQAGARGKTAEEIAAALHAPAKSGDLHKAHADLRRLVLERAAKAGCQLRIANRLWGKEGYKFVPEFVALTRNQYDAELQPLDFTKPAESAEAINAWVEKQTAGKIREFFAPDPEIFNHLTRFIVTNAVYFNGRWAHPFEKYATRPALFTTGIEDERVKVSMMHQQHHFAYAHDDRLQVLQMPYNRSELSMVVLLPKPSAGPLDKIEAALTADYLNDLSSKLKSTDVIVELPKFKIESKFDDLILTLKSLGMTTLVDPDTADLTGIAPEKPLWIYLFKHQTYVDVHEEGTEAAAATGGVGFGGGFEPPPKPVVFRADRPFLFLIRHQPTGAILFLGRVVNPPPSNAAGKS